jgi:hypothetical protein
MPSGYETHGTPAFFSVKEGAFETEADCIQGSLQTAMVRHDVDRKHVVPITAATEHAWAGVLSGRDHGPRSDALLSESSCDAHDHRNPEHLRSLEGKGHGGLALCHGGGFKEWNFCGCRQ